MKLAFWFILSNMISFCLGFFSSCLFIKDEIFDDEDKGGR